MAARSGGSLLSEVEPISVGDIKMIGVAVKKTYQTYTKTHPLTGKKYKTQIEKNMSKQEKKNLGNKPKRQKITIGSIVEISIEGLYYVYAQILSHGGYAFFDCRYEKPLRDLSELLNKPVLFIVGVYDYIIKNNRWSVVGKLPAHKGTVPLCS